MLDGLIDEEAVQMADASRAGGSAAMYSVLLGGYETLNEQPEIAGLPDDGVRRILLTDDPDRTSDFWEVVVVERALADDPVRSQRLLKILGHPVLDEFDVTLYVDNAITLRSSPAAILDDWLGDHDMAVPSHSYRTTILDEFDEILRLRYDDPARVYEQLIAYGEHHVEALETQPYWTAFLARRRVPAVAAAMRIWADHVLRYSRRDQLSAPVALATVPSLRTIEVDNFESEHHRWPTDLARNVAQGKAFAPAAGPFVAELRRRDRAVEEARAEAKEARALATSADAQRNELGRAGAELRDELERVRAELDAERERRATVVRSLDDRSAELEEELSHRLEQERVAMRAAFERSLSWRVTAPLRALRRR